jgi:hypothetical protein
VEKRERESSDSSRQSLPVFIHRALVNYERPSKSSNLRVTSIEQTGDEGAQDSTNDERQETEEIHCCERRQGRVKCETKSIEAGSEDEVFVTMRRNGGNDRRHGSEASTRGGGHGGS